MARLHEYIDERGLYIRARVNTTLVTFQLTAAAQSELRAAGLGDMDYLAPEVLQELIRTGKAYTGGSGASPLHSAPTAEVIEKRCNHESAASSAVCTGGSRASLLIIPPTEEEEYDHEQDKPLPLFRDTPQASTRIASRKAGNQMAQGNNLTRIGVFYDGNYFSHVSNYYQYHHEKRSRISIYGLHDFICHQAAECEGGNIRHCHVVEAHYFRGRLRAVDADERGLLLSERRFDDVLMRAGVVTHYLPLRPNGEMGVDVWLALEAYEQAIHKRFDIVALVVCDGDFLPLVRKLTTLGARVMLLAWDFKFTNQNQEEQVTRTNQVLLDEATYPVMMHQIIDDRARRNDPAVSNLFLPAPPPQPRRPDYREPPGREQREGVIKIVKEGYGFIRQDNDEHDLYFFHSDLLNVDYNELVPGDRVRYTAGQNQRGPCALRITVLERTGA